MPSATWIPLHIETVRFPLITKKEPFAGLQIPGVASVSPSPVARLRGQQLGDQGVAAQQVGQLGAGGAAKARKLQLG